MEPVLGFGPKDVTIEHSTNGTDYTTLGTTHEFVRAPGTPDYAHNTTVDFGGAAAKYVRLTSNINWGGIMNQYGLSEVRFFSIPVFAREPSPDSGTTDAAVDVTLGFRAGREADTHDVYFSTNEQAVIDSNALVTTMTETSYGPLLLDLDTTYYWKINEVNMAETTTMWQGDIWNFTTLEFFVVDDFEDYNDYQPDEIWRTWVDGYGDPANGATAGYPEPLDFPAGEHYMETTIVYGGEQAMPFFYDNTSTATYSEATRTFAVPQDWTKAGVQTLTLQFYGDPNNAPQQMYVKINGARIPYDGDPGNIALALWQRWNIDLTSSGLNLQSVSSLAIGIDDSGASGTLYFDNIRLYGIAPAVTPHQPNPADNLTVNPSLELPDWGPAGTGQWADYVDNWIINNQGNCYLEDGTWEIAASDGVATLKMWSGAAIWQQIGNVSPNTDYEISMFIGRGYDTSAVQVELWAGGDPSALPTSFGIIGETVGATLISGASLTPTIKVGQSELMGLSLNTGADFDSEDALWIRIESIGGGGTAAWVDNVMVTIP